MTGSGNRIPGRCIRRLAAHPYIDARGASNFAAGSAVARHQNDGASMDQTICKVGCKSMPSATTLDEPPSV
jgi:hypothetical protein